MSENNKNDSFANKLKGYQNKLLRLSKANRCVCLSRLYNKHNFDLARLLENHSKKIDELIQQSFKRKKPICILPDSDFSEEADKMRRHLKDLARNIKQLEDETGSQYCYFGFPFLEGHLNKEQYVRGPLILFPISVYYGRGGTSEKSAGWYVKFSDNAPILNHTLFAALEKIGGYKMSETLESDFENIWSPSEGTTSPESEEGLIEKISELLENNGLLLETKDETNSTLTMKKITKDEIELIEPKILKINSYKIIGSFPQGESAIYQDYENLISKTQNGDKNKFIADILGETDSPAEFAEDSEDIDLKDLDSVRDMDLNLILPSDSSQDQIVLSSQNRKITLVEGPPGTGKSQVIVNIISNALAKRQTVLVVCQKRAALEVVHQRLGEKNLDRYAVLLNKEKEDRAKMYLQLRQILEGPADFKPEQKQKLESTSDEIDELIKKHSEIAHALSKKYFDGVTIRELYTKTSSDFSRQLELDAIVDKITSPELERFLNKLSQIEENFKKFEGENHPWRNRIDFSQKTLSDKTKINKILSDILTNSKNYVILSDRPNQDILIELVSKYSHLDNTKTTTNENITKFTESVEKISATNNTSIPLENLEEQIQCVDAGKRLWDKFQDYELINQIKNNHICEDTKEKQIEILDTFLNSEKKSFWKKLVDSETKQKERLKKDFVKRAENSGKTHEKLKIMLENGLELWNIAHDLPQREYIFSKSFVLPDKKDQGYLFDDLKSLNQNKIELEKNSKELQSTVESLQDIFKKHELFFDKNEDVSQLISKVSNGKIILENIDSFAEFVNDKEIQMVKSKITNPQELSSHIQNLHDHLDDFDQLQSHDIRKSELDSTQQFILNQCLSKINPKDKWTDIIEQEIYHCWIEKIEQEHQILKAGHFDNYKENQSRLSSLFEEKSELLVEKIIHSIESNADFRPGTGSRRTQREAEYNELNHELGKKKRVKSVRKLIEQYEHILFDIAPCWLASPAMVSNIFPLEQNMFDIVIVDEASQLAVERALPFLYRGEKIIIAGDEKQLKPHDLFQIKEEDSEDEEYDDISDIESLLVLSKRRHTSTTLQWHYRSKWQELIDFSNHAFYNGILQISPNVQIKAPKPPIEWVECPEGLWENRSNIAEATKVVDTVYEILQDCKNDKSPTIGIITFNDQQRNIIMDEIENRQKKDPAFDELYKKIEMPKSGKKDEEVFVRNIENVQGDERDIIIFSVGYAKDPEGKFRLQFGTLNQDGGENRLNVAITRASQKIIVVCSIDLQDMKVEGTKNPGPKRLKDFLVYARAVSEGDNETVERILESLGSGMSNVQQKGKTFDSDFEEQVYQGLVRLGYTVDTQVGQSGYRIDLAVVHPNDANRYILGVECDGAMFHSGKSVRERDVMRQKFLERRGWNIDRIWSRKWWRNQDKEIQRIHEKIESLV